MALRKIYIAVDCEDDAQKEDVQKLLNELSCMRLFDGRKMLAAYPFYKRYEGEITELFNMVAAGGMKSLMSLRGASLLSKFTKI